MGTMKQTSSALLLMVLLPLMTIGCQLEIEAQPTPTPLPPATPLPPDTPVPPPTPLPTVIQRTGSVVAHFDYATVNMLPGPPDALGKLVTHSTVIVIGTAPNNEPDSIRVQDPSNASVQSVGSGYSLQVERYLIEGIVMSNKT